MRATGWPIRIAGRKAETRTRRIRMGSLEVPHMNVSSARKSFSRRIFSGVAGLILIASPIMVTAAAADPYNSPDDVAAYQAYTAQHYGQPMPPPGQYTAPPNYAQRNQLEAQLNYAEAQYNRAQQSGDWRAAKHWKKQIKHLRRELSGGAALAPATAPVTERRVTCRLRNRTVRRRRLTCRRRATGRRRSSTHRRVPRTRSPIRRPDTHQRAIRTEQPPLHTALPAFLDRRARWAV